MNTVDEEKVAVVVDSFTLTTESGGGGSSSDNETANLSTDDCETPRQSRRTISKMSEASAKFDRHGKGYLDPTERALRQMDSSNKGFLDLDKMYDIMASLQQEQKRNADLTNALLDEQKKGMNMKKGIIALSVFAVLLALANVGTSFAAATLAKDTQVSAHSDLVSSSTGERLGTTNKLTTITARPITEETRRRHLQSGFDCTTQSAPGASCEVVAEFTYNEAMHLYQQFCTEYPVDQYCVNQGPTQLSFNCAGKTSDLFGGSRIPDTPPFYGVDPYVNKQIAVFPTAGRGYFGLMEVGNADGTDCSQVFHMGNTCYFGDAVADEEPCMIFISWFGECTNPVKLCGDGSPASNL